MLQACLTSSFLILTSVSFATPGEVEVTRFGSPDSLRSEHVSALLRSSHGALWVGTRGGVSRFEGGRWTHIEVEQLGMGGVAAIGEGADGQLWFAGPGGVTLFDGQSWLPMGEILEQELGRRVNVAFSAFADEDGSMWFGTTLGALHFDGVQWEWLTQADGLAHDVVHDVHRDQSGRLWFATRRGGISRLDPDGAWHTFHGQDNARAILEDRDGGLWFGTGGAGVLHFDGGSWERHHPTATVLPLFEDSRGNLWFADGSGGAWRLRRGTWTREREHLPAGELNGGLEGADRSLWFGASQGLHRLTKVGR